jgi:hypothetical protein
MDGLIEQTGRVKVVWAWRFAGAADEGMPEEGLLLLINLIPTADFAPTAYGEGMTHEVTVYEIDPATPVDYQTSLFFQKSVSPLVPTTVGFQFHADSNDAAIDRINAVLQRVIDEDLPADVASAWEPMFSDGVRISLKAVHVEAPALAASG